MNNINAIIFINTILHAAMLYRNQNVLGENIYPLLWRIFCLECCKWHFVLLFCLILRTPHAGRGSDSLKKIVVVFSMCNSKNKQKTTTWLSCSLLPKTFVPMFPLNVCSVIPTASYQRNPLRVMILTACTIASKDIIGFVHLRIGWSNWYLSHDVLSGIDIFRNDM